MTQCSYGELMDLRWYLRDTLRKVDRKVSDATLDAIDGGAAERDRADRLCASWCALKDAEAEVTRRLSIMERAGSSDWSRARQIAGLV